MQRYESWASLDTLYEKKIRAIGISLFTITNKKMIDQLLTVISLGIYRSSDQ